LEHIKRVNVQESKSTYAYKSAKIKKKLLETKAAIWFDKMCRIINLTQRYINITINCNSQQRIKTKRMASTYGINQNQSAFVGLSVHFIHPINARNVEYIKFICFCVFVKYSPALNFTEL
jgi:hypothetical protein